MTTVRKGQAPGPMPRDIFRAHFQRSFFDPAFDPALATTAVRLTSATHAMRDALHKSGQIDLVTYKPAEGAPDRVAEARDVVRRLVSYADLVPIG